MNQAAVEAILEREALALVSARAGARVVSQGKMHVLVESGGWPPGGRVLHYALCVITCGGWLVVFLPLLWHRRVRRTVITVHPDGSVTRHTP